MKASTFVRTAMVLVVAAAVAAPAAAQNGTMGNWKIKINETRGPVRAADITSPLGKEVVSEVLAGPTNGNDAGYLIFTRMPAGAKGPAMFTLPDNHFYLVLEGKMNVKIGTDSFVADKMSGVIVPANTPHEVSNADAGETRVFEVIAPGSNRDLKDMMKPAQPRKVENAAAMIKTPKIPMAAEMKPGLNGARYTGRTEGTAQQMRIDSTLPGAGGPKPHVHKFTQIYFSIEGETTLTHGLVDIPLPKYSVGVITPGTAHTNNNKTTAVERHIVLLLDELPIPRTEPLDVEIEFKGGFGN
jgi:mannose-6-phosphate isomerase-like protein (cupin superfamily)